ncbi:7TM-DISM domain-containing protein [Caenimonas terrae]|uniref:7TM-DISM domain-containing protein n=1 Tax=Caenimonas terrae TaxID=696074 RepID=A0ABW0N835_9BURK
MRWLASHPLARCKAAFGAWAAAFTLLLWCGGPAAQAQIALAARHPPPVILDDARSPLLDPAPALEWTDPQGQATLAQVVAGQGGFQPRQPERIHVLGTSGVLWLQLRLVRPTSSHSEWMIELPLPPLDAVTLYQQDPAGSWHGQSAGDRIAVASWPERGRYPVFRLEVPPGEARDVYLRVTHNARSDIPLRIASATNYGQRMQLAYLGLGLVFGGLVLVIAACLAQSWLYRDRAFLGYAAYASTIALAMAAFTGAAAHFLWPHSGTVADAAQGGLGLLSAAAAILFVRDLSGIAARSPRLAAFARWTGLLVPLLLAAYVLVDRPIGTVVLGGYLFLACALNLVIAWRAWRRGDRPSFWVLLAYLPMGVAVVLTLERIFGLSPASWANQYGLVAAMALQVPLLLVALSIHSRERHGAVIRELALSSQDALTGLLAPHLFHDRLRQLVVRHRRHGENAAVLFIDLANCARIKQQHGSAVAEQSLLRSVIKLRRLLRETDTLSRIGEARFGLILERAGTRVTVMDRAARVVAAGKMPAKGTKPDVPLQFHVAAALLDEVEMDTPELEAALATLLDSIPATTRRPIRFVGEVATEPLPPLAHGEDGIPLSEGPASA